MSSTTKLAPVYAVQVRVEDGVPRYIPRSQASVTATAPKLWVRRLDAERVAKSLPHWLRRIPTETRVVKFRLVPVDEEADR